jgi:hypothetical protein
VVYKAAYSILPREFRCQQLSLSWFSTRLLTCVDSPTSRRNFPSARLSKTTYTPAVSLRLALLVYGPSNE